VRTVTTLAYCDRTDIGRRRASNQDSKAVLPASPQEYRSRGWLFLVADGMGAHAAGELASAMAATNVPRRYEELSDFSPPLALRRSIERVNVEIFRKGERSPDCHGMGTTCSALVLHPRGAILGHVGDSRIYRVRGHTVHQLSRDHSLVWEIEATVGARHEDATESVPKNIITRSLGPHLETERLVDLEGPFPVEAGDTFVLCSDGLSGVVGDAEIGLFASELEPQEAVTALIGLALVRGAPDNVTVIGVRAGPEEASKTSRNDEPWPLSEEATSNQRQGHKAWASLGLAAFGWLLALTVNPMSALAESFHDGDPTLKAICLATSIGGALIGVGCTLFSVFTFLSAKSRGRLLHPGEFLGKGPYRTYDCTPAAGLLEGVVTSLEAEAEAIPAADRDRFVGILARARQHAAAAAHHEAVTALAEAIAVHAAAIEAARRDDTAHTKPPPGTPHA